MTWFRTTLLSLFCLAPVFASTAPTASDQARQRLTEALHDQIKQWFIALSAKRPPPTGALTDEQLNQQTDALLQQALARYGPVFTLPEQTAQLLLAKGPDDADNAAAM
jgi:hypothetical protein